MSKPNLAVMTVAVVVLMALLATIYRVSTAPDRIRERRGLAQTTCINKGGQWVMVDNQEACVSASDLKKL